MNFHRTSAGFTLIELIIVIMIIGILAAIALPQYNEYVTRGKVTDALATLSSHALKLEQYYQDNRNYGPNSTTPGVANPPASAYYSYSCVPAGATLQSITCTADGTANGLGSYTINESGTKTTVTAPTGWSGTGNTCWVRNKGGGC